MTVTTESVPMAGSTVMVQNMMSGPTVIALDAKRSYEMIFGGNGDPHGEDIQEIPEEMLRAKQFRDALRKGVFTIVEGHDHPAVVQAMARQTDSFRNRMAADDLAAREVIDAPHDGDLLVVTCIGPGSREGAVCGDMVAIKEKDQSARPPLCSRHSHLAERCVKRGSGPWKIELD